MRLSKYFLLGLLTFLLLTVCAYAGESSSSAGNTAQELEGKIEKFLKLRRKIADHESAPEKKDVKKIQQLQQTFTALKDELIKAGVDINAKALEDEKFLKSKEARTKLKAEEKALEAEFRAAWSDVLAGKGLLDHCQDKKAATCMPQDPEHDAAITSMEQRLEARVKKLELRLEEAKYKLTWFKSRGAKKDEL